MKVTFNTMMGTATQGKDTVSCKWILSWDCQKHLVGIFYSLHISHKNGVFHVFNMYPTAHICIRVPDPYTMAKTLQENGVDVFKKPDLGIVV